MRCWSCWKTYVVAPCVPLSIREYIQFEVEAPGQIILLRNDKTAHGKIFGGTTKSEAVVRGLSMSYAPVIITWIIGLARRSMFKSIMS